MQIEEITAERAEEIIEKYEPEGLFFFTENGKYIGIDNSTGDAWTEEFETLEECEKWLKGEDDGIEE